MENKKIDNLPETYFDLNVARTLIPLKDMGRDHLVELFKYSQTRFIYKGQTIFSAGSVDDAHVYLLYGEVTLYDTEGNKERVKGRDTLLPLVHNQPRLHTAIAKTDCSILSISSAWLDKLLTWSQVADYLHTIISREPNYDEDHEWMMNILSSNLFFKVPPINVEKIFSEITTRLVYKDEVIIHQGQVGNECYFIKEGDACVTHIVDGEREVLAYIGGGRCFGEDALVKDTARSATVTMTGDGVLMCLDKHDFYQLLQEPEVSMITLRELDALGESIPVMVDVRSDSEYALSHYPGSVNVPLHLLAIKARQLLLTVDYVIYCDTGRRSKAATCLLTEQGFKVSCLRDSADLFSHLYQRHRLVSGENHILRHGLPVKGD